MSYLLLNRRGSFVYRDIRLEVSIVRIKVSSYSFRARSHSLYTKLLAFKQGVEVHNVRMKGTSPSPRVGLQTVSQ